MFNLFSHAVHTHELTTMSAIDHCGPLVIGFVTIIVSLLLVIAYLVNTWQPKSFTNNKKKTTKK